jgi:hypothetical protein
MILLTLALCGVAIAQPLDTLWTRTYGGNSGEEGTAVCATIDGGFAIVGLTSSLGAGGSDAWLVKTDSAGNIEWNRTYGGNGYDGINAIVQTADSGFVLAGRCNGAPYLNQDGWVIKTDRLGDTVWTRTFSVDTLANFESVQQTSGCRLHCSRQPDACRRVAVQRLSCTIEQPRRYPMDADAR